MASGPRVPWKEFMAFIEEYGIPKDEIAELWEVLERNDFSLSRALLPWVTALSTLPAEALLRVASFIEARNPSGAELLTERALEITQDEQIIDQAGRALLPAKYCYLAARLSRELRDLRSKHAGLSIEDVAEKTGIQARDLRVFETRTSEVLPTPHQLSTLINLYNVPEGEGYLVQLIGKSRSRDFLAPILEEVGIADDEDEA